MLKMAQKEYIKHLYEVEDKSVLEIANTTGFNYRTVRKYAYQEDWSNDDLPNIEPTSYPVLESYIPTIDAWLEADRKIPRKQRHTVKRIYDRLRDECGFPGSYSSVKKYVRKKKFVMKAATEGYLPLAHPDGCGQVDFGEFIYHDAKKDDLAEFVEGYLSHVIVLGTGPMPDLVQEVFSAAQVQGHTCHFLSGE